MLLLLSNPYLTRDCWEKVYLRSQILERPSIDEYWNISGVPVLPENVIFTFFRTCRCYSEAFNTGTQKWSSIVQYSCTSIWDLKYTFSDCCNNPRRVFSPADFFYRFNVYDVIERRTKTDGTYFGLWLRIGIKHSMIRPLL